MTFGFADGAPGSLVVLHVKRTVFCGVISVFLANVAKGFDLYKSNVLSAIFLSTVIFRMTGRRAFGTPDLLILESQFLQRLLYVLDLFFQYVVRGVSRYVFVHLHLKRFC